MKKSKEAPISVDKQSKLLLLILLILFSLLLGALPSLSFGQGQDGFGGFPATGPAPAANTTTFGPPTGPAPAPAPTQLTVPLAPAPPAPVATTPPPPKPAPTTPAPPVRSAAGIADQRPVLPIADPNVKPRPTVQQIAAQQTTIQKLLEPTQQMLKDRPELIRSVVSEDHPYFNFYNLPEQPKNPNEPKPTIQGKPFTVAQLIEGTWSPQTRESLLKAYWELSGCLAEYNIRFNAERQIQLWYAEAKNANNAQRTDEFFGAFHIAQQQRRAAEFTFLKKQTELVELLQSRRGMSNMQPEDYPIPCDYPSAKTYVTYADKIAHSQRAKLLSRLLPYQEQLIDARKQERAAAERFFQATTKNRQGSVQDYVSVLNQRTGAFVDLVNVVVDYNTMIAEYTTETISGGISTYRMVGALIELPKFEGGTPDLPKGPPGPKPQIASPRTSTFSSIETKPPKPPKTFATEPSATEPTTTKPDLLTQNPSTEALPLATPTAAPVSDVPPGNPYASVATPPQPPTDAPPGNPFAPTPPPNPIQPASYTEMK